MPGVKSGNAQGKEAVVPSDVLICNEESPFETVNFLYWKCPIRASTFSCPGHVVLALTAACV